MSSWSMAIIFFGRMVGKTLWMEGPKLFNAPSVGALEKGIGTQEASTISGVYGVDYYYGVPIPRVPPCFRYDTVDGRSPAPVDMLKYSIVYRVLYIPAGAGILPSTVSPEFASCHRQEKEDSKIHLHIFFAEFFDIEIGMI